HTASAIFGAPLSTNREPFGRLSISRSALIARSTYHKPTVDQIHNRNRHYLWANQRSPAPSLPLLKRIAKANCVQPISETIPDIALLPVPLPIESSAHLADKRRRRKRFLQQHDIGIEPAVVHDRIVGIARDKQHLDIAIQLFNMLGQHFSAHLRHYHIGEQELDGWSRPSASQGDRFAAVR